MHYRNGCLQPKTKSLKTVNSGFGNAALRGHRPLFVLLAFFVLYLFMLFLPIAVDDDYVDICSGDICVTLHQDVL